MTRQIQTTQIQQRNTDAPQHTGKNQKQIRKELRKSTSGREAKAHQKVIDIHIHTHAIKSEETQKSHKKIISVYTRRIN